MQENAVPSSVNEDKKGKYGARCCVKCGGKFEPRIREQRFCCKGCRQAYHNTTYYMGKAARGVLLSGEQG